jgi:hypothetical protein
MFTSQGLGNLWLLGVVTFGIFAIPSIEAAGLGALIAKVSEKIWSSSGLNIYLSSACGLPFLVCLSLTESPQRFTAYI